MGFFRANHSAVFTLVHQTTEFRQTTGCIHNDTVRQSSGCPAHALPFLFFCRFSKRGEIQESALDRAVDFIL
jgi:hypothetical protein